VLLSKVTLYFFFACERERKLAIPFGSNQTVPYPGKVAYSLVEDVPEWQCMCMIVSVTHKSFTSLGLKKSNVGCLSSRIQS
jgi:hypothetical protein